MRTNRLLFPSFPAASPQGREFARNGAAAAASGCVRSAWPWAWLPGLARKG